MRYKFVTVGLILVGLQTQVHGQDRVNSPYAFCGAEEAKRQYKTRDSIPQIQAKAEQACEKYFERNLSNSVEAIIRDAKASGKPLPKQARRDLRLIVGPELRAAFKFLIQNNVTVLRQSGS